MALLDEIKIECRWFVTRNNGLDFGPMLDFYSGTSSAPTSIIRNPYPFKKGQYGFSSESDAMDAMKKLVAHVEAVNELPENKKLGSSKYWNK